MIIQVADWMFDVNISQTMAYSSGVWENHCQCGYCRNFYLTLNDAYPQLKTFLEQFGMNSLTPEEMSPIEPTLCIASYCICGRIIQHGLYPIDIDGVVFKVSKQEDNPDYDPGFRESFFVLTTGLLDLPWILEEDMDDVISPANEPEYMKRMMNRLLENTDFGTIIS